MSIGRNAPCPCGSGRKYKKCCWQRDQAARKDESLEVAVTPAIEIPQPVKNGTDDEFDDQTYNEFDDGFAAVPPDADPWWEEFIAADCDNQVAMVVERFKDPQTLHPEDAYEMLSEVRSRASEPADRKRIAELVELLRAHHEETYRENRSYLLSWLIEDALLEEDRNRLDALAMEMAAAAADNIDLFTPIRHRLAFDGELDLLVRMMATAWPEVKESAGILPIGVEEFASDAAAYESYHYCTHNARPEGSDPELEDRLLEYVSSFDPADAELMINHLMGRADYDWTIEEFEHVLLGRYSPEDGPAPFRRISFEAVGYLWREEKMPVTRAHLVVEKLLDYVLERAQRSSDGRRRRATKLAVSRKMLFCPDRNSLDHFLAGYLDLFYMQPAVVAAILYGLPGWLRFLRSRGLLDKESRSRALSDLKPLCAQVVRLFDSDATWRPLNENLEAVWESDPLAVS